MHILDIFINYYMILIQISLDLFEILRIMFLRGGGNRAIEWVNTKMIRSREIPFKCHSSVTQEVPNSCPIEYTCFFHSYFRNLFQIVGHFSEHAMFLLKN